MGNRVDSIMRRKATFGEHPNSVNSRDRFNPNASTLIRNRPIYGFGMRCLASLSIPWAIASWITTALIASVILQTAAEANLEILALIQKLMFRFLSTINSEEDA